MKILLCSVYLEQVVVGLVEVYTFVAVKRRLHQVLASLDERVKGFVGELSVTKRWVDSLSVRIVKVGVESIDACPFLQKSEHLRILNRKADQ